MLNSNPLWNRIQGNWKQISGQVRQRWGLLTDDEVTHLDGQREQLAGIIQDRYGITQQEANQQIDEWAEKLKF